MATIIGLQYAGIVKSGTIRRLTSDFFCTHILRALCTITVPLHYVHCALCAINTVRVCHPSTLCRLLKHFPPIR